MNRAKIDDAEYTGRLFSLFPFLNEQDKKRIESGITIMHLPKGKYVYREGETPKGFICLVEGNAKVVKSGLIIRMVGTMGIIGYRALFAGENYRSSAQTLDESVIAIIERETFFGVLRRNAELSLTILSLIARELGMSNKRTVNLTQKHLRGRLADTLLFLIETYGFRAGSRVIGVTLSRKDLAQLSSMTTSNAIRTLSAFASEGVVALDGKRIIVPNIEQLQRISHLGY